MTVEIASTEVSERASWSARLDELTERPRPLFLALFIIFLLVFSASILLVPRRYGRLIVGDGIYYYVYLRSAVIDHDLDFTNDYQLYQSFNNEDPEKKRQMLELNRTPLGRPGNLFSVGPAVLWSPVFIPTHLLALALGLPHDGFSYLYEAPVLLLSIAYGFLGILLTYRVAAGLFSRWAALVAALGVWLATNVVYYMGVSPSASHVLSLFAVSLFLYWWYRTRARRTPRDWLVWGLCAGLMALVRWQDSLVALLALFEWVAGWREAWRHLSTAPAQAPRDDERGAPPLLAAIREWLPRGLLFVLGALLAFSPQIVAWQALYGLPLTAPQGNTFFYFNRPEIWNVLFGLKRGLFTWTPLVLAAVVGFLPLYRRYPRLGASAAVVFVLETYLNSIVYDWWGGEAFGARRFVGLMPFFALGLAPLVHAGRAWLSRQLVLAALGALIFYNMLFVMQYDLWLHGIGHISANPTLAEITVDKFAAPFYLLSRIK